MVKNLDRQSFLGPQMESVLSGSTLGIIGLCGGGSHVAQQTAHIGFSKFVIADHDDVEDHNLNRMIGSTPADAESSALKTSVISRLIKSINPAAEVQPISSDWLLNETDFHKCSAILSCVDSYTARDSIERFCRTHRIPMIDVGMDVCGHDEGYSISGQVILSLPDRPCMRCMGFITDERLNREQQLYGLAGGRPQVVWPNGVLASTAVSQLMQLVLPWNLRTPPSLMIEYDGDRNILKPSSRLKAISDHCCHF